MNALEVMEEIDGMIFDQLGEKEYARLVEEFGCLLGYRSSGGCDGVYFLNNCVYCSENSHREWDDEKDDYVLSLKDFIIQEINKFIDIAEKLRIKQVNDKI